MNGEQKYKDEKQTDKPSSQSKKSLSCGDKYTFCFGSRGIFDPFQMQIVDV